MSMGVMARRMSTVPFSSDVSKTSAVNVADCESENCCWRTAGERWCRAEATMLRYASNDMARRTK
jgi:hypothetical protein